MPSGGGPPINYLTYRYKSSYVLVLIYFLYSENKTCIFGPTHQRHDGPAAEGLAVHLDMI
jgi:hypothetical protein